MKEKYQLELPEHVKCFST